jgi:hypothetical protein
MTEFVRVLVISEEVINAGFAVEGVLDLLI